MGPLASSWAFLMINIHVERRETKKVRFKYRPRLCAAPAPGSLRKCPRGCRALKAEPAILSQELYSQARRSSEMLGKRRL